MMHSPLWLFAVMLFAIAAVFFVAFALKMGGAGLAEAFIQRRSGAAAQEPPRAAAVEEGDVGSPDRRVRVVQVGPHRHELDDD